MSKVIIGKHTLESLTSGMYSDPFVIYREYVQNSTDSIDNAYKKGYLSPGEELITVILNQLDGIITVTDNGLGIPTSEAEQVLISLGDSKKNVSTSRGFRGIGRLAALSYCSNLVFKTTYPGENVGTKVTIEASVLTELLSFNNADKRRMTAEEVLNAVCYTEKYDAKNDEHYFKVELHDVDQTCKLLDYELVKEYLEQTAPVPFNSRSFTWEKEISKIFLAYGYSIPHYRIQIKHGTNLNSIFKTYKDSFLSDKSREMYDNIQDIEVFQLQKRNGFPMAILWIAHSNYMGTIADRSIKGLRLRQGNILVGDGQTLNCIFKDARFNGWTIGEVHIIDSEIMPNARRDNLEQNPAYFVFIEQMTAFASNIAKKIRSLSLSKNKKLAEIIKRKDKTSNMAEELLETPNISASKKGAITKKIDTVKQEIYEIKPANNTETLIQEIAFNELDILLDKVHGATAFKAINMLSSLSKAEKKTLEKVFFVLQEKLSRKDFEEAADIILEAFF